MRHEHAREALVAASIVLACAGCGRGARLPGVPEIVLHAPASPADRAFVEVTGLSPQELSRLRGARLGIFAWQGLLKVTVVGSASPETLPPVQGAYGVTETGVTFTPLFPFDPGRAYRVVFAPATLPRSERTAVVTAVVSLPARQGLPTAVVTAVYPSAPVLPENLLRIYIEFSAPMGNGSTREFVRILDETGREVAMPFLPVDADFWNPDHTRCTLFFDPGRVKRGILPNQQLGRPLQHGRRYVLEIAPGWPDAQGYPLKAGYRRGFRVGPAADRAIAPSSWRIVPPAAGTRDSLVVTFLEPLDHGLLARALAVETEDQRPFDGDIALEADDTRWRFTPVAPWPRGNYTLVALSILEDPAGNRIGRAFESAPGVKNVDQAPDEFRVAFTVARP